MAFSLSPTYLFRMLGPCHDLGFLGVEFLCQCTRDQRLTASWGTVPRMKFCVSVIRELFQEKHHVQKHSLDRFLVDLSKKRRRYDTTHKGTNENLLELLVQSTDSHRYESTRWNDVSGFVISLTQKHDFRVSIFLELKQGLRFHHRTLC